MMSLNVVTIYDNRRWDRYIRHAHMSDFNHTWHYHSTAADGEALLLIYEEGNEFIALPVIKRNDSEVDGIRWHSLYSYAGPVSSCNFAMLGSGMQERFEHAFKAYIEQHSIRSVCIQLHPLIHENFKPLDLGVLKPNNQSILIDVGEAPGLREDHYGADFNNGVNLLKRKGYTARRAVAINDVDDFADMFRHNMHPLNSDAAARYDKAWFRQMLRPAGFDTCLLLAGQGNDITAGMLLTFCNDLMQLHLAATDENYLFDAPLRMLLHEAVMLGRTLGMQYMQLEGLAGRPEALFAARVFSHEIYPGFKTWQVSYGEACTNIRSGKLRRPLSLAV